MRDRACVVSAPLSPSQSHPYTASYGAGTWTRCQLVVAGDPACEMVVRQEDGYIGWMTTAPRWRGIGVGRLLVGRVLKSGAVAALRVGECSVAADRMFNRLAILEGYRVAPDPHPVYSKRIGPSARYTAVDCPRVVTMVRSTASADE